MIASDPSHWLYFIFYTKTILNKSSNTLKLISCEQVKCMERPGTEAIRTQIQSSKLKREITKMTNSQNTKRTHGQPTQNRPLSNPKRTKHNTNTRKVNVTEIPTAKSGNRDPQQNTRKSKQTTISHSNTYCNTRLNRKLFREQWKIQHCISNRKVRVFEADLVENYQILFYSS